MEILSIILGLLPSAIKCAEAIWGKIPKSGEQKKAEVKSGLASFAKTMANVSTGGQKETWEAIDALMPAIDNAIDVTVSGLNNMGLLGDVFNESTN